MYPDATRPGVRERVWDGAPSAAVGGAETTQGAGTAVEPLLPRALVFGPAGDESEPRQGLRAAPPVGDQNPIVWAGRPPLQLVGNASEVFMGAVGRMADELAPEGSETSSTFENRAADLFDRLEEAGAQEEDIALAAMVEQHIRTLKSEWGTNQMARGVSMEMYATKLLEQADFLRFACYPQECQARLVALSKLARVRAAAFGPRLAQVESAAAAVAADQAAADEANATRVCDSVSPVAVRDAETAHRVASPASSPVYPSLFTVREDSTSPERVPVRQRADMTPSPVPPVASTSWGCNNMQDLATVVAMAVTEANRALGVSEDGPRVEKVQALAGLKFDQTLPVLKDNDLDFEGHWLKLESILNCHGVGRQGVRPIDVLTLYRKCLQQGGTRSRMF